MDQVEKRKHRRLPIRMDAELFLPNGQACQGTTENISFGGLFVIFATLPPVEIGDEYDLSLLLDGVAKTIDLWCEAVHIRGNGVGFQFVQIEVEDYLHFKNLMVLNSDDPEGLLDELKRHPGLTVGER